jgi:sigma-54 dependent transcriptional regulator, acetoin dehydrogenase operon transcriptional activator AcoR
MDVLPNPDRLHVTRDALRTGGLLAADPSTADVRDPILRSWRRCVSADISAEQIRTRRIDRANASEVLTRAAAPVLDRLRDELADLGVAVILSNRSGRIISRRVADTRQQDRLDDNYVLEGFDYSEQTVGTNGLGTAIAENKAVWVHGAEHFNDALQVFACVGVPILSPRGGSVAGSLSLAATAAASNPMMMSLTKFAARQVEQELRSMVYARESALASAFSQRSRGHDGPAMLLTDDSVLSDTRLLPLMTPSSHVALWEAVHQHDWSDPTASFEIALGGSSVGVEARRIEDADGPAYLLHFPRPLPARGGAAVLTDPSTRSPAILDRSRAPQRVHPVAKVNARLLAASTSADLLALNGPAGSGRQHTAARMAIVTGRELLVLDATMFAGAPFHDWLVQANRALAAGSCVVVRNAQQLSVDSFAGIESMAGDQSRTREGRGLLIATVDLVEAPSPVRDLLDRLAVTIDLPALADMPESIPYIADEILGSLGDGGRPPQLSSSTLQALLRWSWPGNIRELRTVLLGASASARGTVIRTDDLPPRLVAAHRARSLSGIERAERSAIVEALSRSNGNRSRAAEALGIGRTTLYRKLRELKIASSGEWLE